MGPFFDAVANKTNRDVEDEDEDLTRTRRNNNFKQPSRKFDIGDIVEGVFMTMERRNGLRGKLLIHTSHKRSGSAGRTTLSTLIITWIIT